MVTGSVLMSCWRRRDEGAISAVTRGTHYRTAGRPTCLDAGRHYVIGAAYEHRARPLDREMRRSPPPGCARLLLKVNKVESHVVTTYRTWRPRFPVTTPDILNPQLPCSPRQPHSSPSVSVHAPATSSYSLNLPLSPSITPSLSLLAQDLPFSQIFPTIDSLPASGLTPRLYDWSVSSEHLGFYF